MLFVIDCLKLKVIIIAGIDLNSLVNFLDKGIDLVVYKAIIKYFQTIISFQFSYGVFHVIIILFKEPSFSFIH